MALYNDEGELVGYRFKIEPEKPVKHRLYDVGTHIVFPKFLSESLSIAVAIA